MQRRRYNPYSFSQELRLARRELGLLAVSTVGFGLALNIVASVIYGFTVGGEARSVGALLLLVLGIAVIVGSAYYIVSTFYSRRQSATLRLEIALPYLAPKGQPISVVPQRDEPVAYWPARLGQQRFAQVYAGPTPVAQQFFEAWRAATQERKPFNWFVAAQHKALVYCLLLDALHSYGQASLGTGARFRVWHSTLDKQELSSENLPAVLKENLLVQNLMQEAPDWKLLLPVDVEFIIRPGNGDVDHEWCLHHPDYGDVILRTLRRYWPANTDEHIGRVLGERVPQGQRRSLWVLVSRVEAWILLPKVYRRNVDLFHDWATGLLAFLEETLDWAYFDQQRTEMMLAELCARLTAQSRDVDAR